MTALAHLGYGMVGGAVYAATLGRARAVPRPLSGLCFGLLVWLGSYEGWVPALRMMPPASRDRPDRVFTMVAAHVVYGAFMGWCLDRLERRSERRRTEARASAAPGGEAAQSVETATCAA
jgi:hypothetical protein